MCRAYDAIRSPGAVRAINPMFIDPLPRTLLLTYAGEYSSTPTDRNKWYRQRCTPTRSSRLLGLLTSESGPIAP